VSSFGHASYIPCKVRFDFSNVRIEKLRTRAANVVLVWERRDKTITTEQQVVRSGNVSFSDGLHLECTLFKDPDSNDFQQKQAKFAVRVFSKEGKTIAKIHFNVAEYILVPSGSQDIKLSLSDGSILKGLVTTTLAKSGRPVWLCSEYDALIHVLVSRIYAFHMKRETFFDVLDASLPWLTTGTRKSWRKQCGLFGVHQRERRPQSSWRF